MAVSRCARSSPSRRMIVLFSALFLMLLAPASAKASPMDRSGSRAAEEMICHTDKTEECYPKLFQATNEFKVIREDQDLPSGLHVRLNIYTGQKEAKIYNPDEDVDPALEGLPVDSDVVVVEAEKSDEVKPPPSAPQYESAGKIKQPEHEPIFVYETLEALRSPHLPQEAWFDEALERLEDISHDIYYGLKIAEDYQAVKGLLCLISDRNAPAVNGTVPRDQQAALILSGALQNNPSALREISSQWHSIMKDATCPHDQQPLDVSFWHSIEPSGVQPTHTDAAKIKAKVSVMNGLIKDETLRHAFFAHGAIKSLLEVVIAEGKDWAGAQRKVGQLLSDNFLDEDMGATLGQWPRVAKLSDEECQKRETALREGCWDYHVERVVKANRWSKDHWSKDLNDKLKAARGGGSNTERHEDL